MSAATIVGSAFVAFAVVITGCDMPDTCDARGVSTSFTGFATHASAGAMATTESTTIVVFDYQQACTYADEEFLVSGAGCDLWLTLTKAPEGHGSPDTVASVEPGQTCQLSLDGSSVAFTTGAGGSLIFSDGHVDLALTGTVGEPPGVFSWSFHASGAAP